jgi:hypothetical protein
MGRAVPTNASHWERALMPERRASVATWAQQVKVRMGCLIVYRVPSLCCVYLPPCVTVHEWAATHPTEFAGVVGVYRLGMSS